MMNDESTPHGSPWRSRYTRQCDTSSLVRGLTADELAEILRWIESGGFCDVAAIVARYLDTRSQ
jgi:hypothetical protein